MSTSSTELRRFAFHIEYEGTNYHGWQRQRSVSPTIQETLETALEDFFQAPCPIQGASRTDAGVHAQDQVAAVSFAHPIRPEGFVKALNARLPPDIAIRAARQVPLDFNPRFQNAGKTYCYGLYRSGQRQPLLDRQRTRLRWDIDLERVQRASAYLIGTHDFRSFAASDGQHQTTERTITHIEWVQDGVCEWTMRVSGTAFLKHMVRNLVGTLIEVGRGKVDANSIPSILSARNREAAGPTAPANGLCLEHIDMMYGP